MYARILIFVLAVGFVASTSVALPNGVVNGIEAVSGMVLYKNLRYASSQPYQQSIPTMANDTLLSNLEDSCCWRHSESGLNSDGTQCHTLSILSPGLTGGPFPVMVFFEGDTCFGNYKSLIDDDYVKNVFVFVSIRTGPFALNFPAMLNGSIHEDLALSDAMNALAFVTQHIAAFGGAPSPIGVVGVDSAARVALQASPPGARVLVHRPIHGLPKSKASAETVLEVLRSLNASSALSQGDAAVLSSLSSIPLPFSVPRNSPDIIGVDEMDRSVIDKCPTEKSFLLPYLQSVLEREWLGTWRRHTAGWAAVLPYWDTLIADVWTALGLRTCSDCCTTVQDLVYYVTRECPLKVSASTNTRVYSVQCPTGGCCTGFGYAAVEQCTSRYGKCSAQSSAQYFGSIIQIVPSSSISDCQSICLGYRQCAAYTYVPTGQQRGCWMWSSVTSVFTGGGSSALYTSGNCTRDNPSLDSSFTDLWRSWISGDITNWYPYSCEPANILRIRSTKVEFRDSICSLFEAMAVKLSLADGSTPPSPACVRPMGTPPPVQANSTVTRTPTPTPTPSPTSSPPSSLPILTITDLTAVLPVEVNGTVLVKGSALTRLQSSSSGSSTIWRLELRNTSASLSGRVSVSQGVKVFGSASIVLEPNTVLTLSGELLCESSSAITITGGTNTSLILQGRIAAGCRVEVFTATLRTRPSLAAVFEASLTVTVQYATIQGNVAFSTPSLSSIKGTVDFNETVILGPAGASLALRAGSMTLRGVRFRHLNLTIGNNECVNITAIDGSCDVASVSGSGEFENVFVLGRHTFSITRPSIAQHLITDPGSYLNLAMRDNSPAIITKWSFIGGSVAVDIETSDLVHKNFTVMGNIVNSVPLDSITVFCSPCLYNWKPEATIGQDGYFNISYTSLATGNVQSQTIQVFLEISPALLDEAMFLRQAALTLRIAEPQMQIIQTSERNVGGSAGTTVFVKYTFVSTRDANYLGQRLLDMWKYNPYTFRLSEVSSISSGTRGGVDVTPTGLRVTGVVWQGPPPRFSAVARSYWAISVGGGAVLALFLVVIVLHWVEWLP